MMRPRRRSDIRAESPILRGPGSKRHLREGGLADDSRRTDSVEISKSRDKWARRCFSLLPSWQEITDGLSAIRMRSTRGNSGHFYNLAHFRSIVAVLCRIVGAEEPRDDLERLDFFSNPHQFLLFGPEYVVWIFHQGGPLTG